MFISIERGLQVYKDTVRLYLIRKEEIESKNKQARQAEGLDYRGSIDWTPDDWKWKQINDHVLCGMELVLGLSQEEIDNIRDKIKLLTNSIISV